MHIGVGESDKECHRGNKVKYEPKNWKQLSEKQISKLTQIERSRYLAVSQYRYLKFTFACMGR